MIGGGCILKGCHFSARGCEARAKLGTASRCWKGGLLNLGLADKEANGVRLTPPGLAVSAGEAAEFMSKYCVTMREGDRG